MIVCSSLDIPDEGVTVLAGTEINDVEVTVVGATLSVDVLDGVVSTDVALVGLSTGEELSATELDD